MSGYKTYHVSQRDNGNWAVTAAGRSNASIVCSTQKEAIKRGKKLARNQGADFQIHKQDGKFRKQNYHH